MIGLLGGTFDPIHNGHLQLAQQALQAFDLSRVEFLPCHVPVHREIPGGDPAQRAQMVNLAIDKEPRFASNFIELQRGGPSYTVDTLHELCRADPREAYCWLMGGDTFNGFDRWKDPRGILELAHVIVCDRPGTEIRAELYPQHRLAEGESLHHFSHGKIAVLPIKPNACSATEVRGQLARGGSPDDCLAPAVLDFIHQRKLYRATTTEQV